MTHMVHDRKKEEEGEQEEEKRKKKIHSIAEACTSFSRKLDLDQTPIRVIERHKCDKAHFSVANLGFIRFV